MKNKVLIRKQAGGGLQYQVTQQGSAPKTSFLGNLAALRGGARGLVKDPNNPNNVRQGFIPGSQLGNAKPTAMQRLAAGANVAGTGLAAALTGLQTAYGLQGGNIGALGTIKDQFRANVGGLTGGSPTEAQQTQDMATKEYQERQREMARLAMLNQAQDEVSQRNDPTQVTQTAAPQQTAVPQIRGPVAVSLPLHTPQGPYSNQALLQQMTTQQPQQMTQQPQPNLDVGVSPTNMQTAAHLAQQTGFQPDQTTTQMPPIQTNVTTTAEQFPYQPTLSQYQPSATTQTSLQDDFNVQSPVQPPMQPMRTFATTTPFNMQQMTQLQDIHNMMQRGGAGAQGTIDTQLQQFNQGLREGMPSVTRENIGQYLNKSFVDYAYELHGDILRKATPHEAGLLVMNMYLEMLR